MKKIVLLLAVCLALAAAGFADSGGPAVYINNQAQVPQSSVMVDSNGDCWVDANYVPLTQAEKDKLSNSTLNYQEFYQGNAFLDLTALASFLGWKLTNSGGTVTVNTPSYQPLTSSTPAGGGGGRPSVTTDIAYTPSASEVLQQQQDQMDAQSDDLPPYMYYFSGPDDGGYGGYDNYNYHDHNLNPNNRLYSGGNSFSAAQADFHSAASSFHGGGGGGFHGGGRR